MEESEPQMKLFRPGDTRPVAQASSAAVAICEEHAESVCMIYRGVSVIVEPGMLPTDVEDYWEVVMDVKRSILCKGR